MTQFIDTLVGIFQSSGFARFGEPGGYLYAVMICVGCFLLYLAIVKEFEPLTQSRWSPNQKVGRLRTRRTSCRCHNSSWPVLIQPAAIKHILITSSVIP